jgi:hypothetical protein
MAKIPPSVFLSWHAQNKKIGNLELKNEYSVGD